MEFKYQARKDRLKTEIKNDYISKDIIRNEIKELEKLLKLENFKDGAKIEIAALKRLLKEN